MIEIELKSNQLKEDVYYELNKDRSLPLYDDDLERIDQLALSGIDFLDEPTDITLCDLIFFKNLKSCTIINKDISGDELKIFSRLKNIETVQFTKCEFPKIDINNSSIEYLIIDECGSVDLELFSNMAQLKRLRIVNCDVTNLEAVSKFENLTELYLQNLQLEKISGIDELKNLTYLNLNGTKLKEELKLDENSKIKVVHEKQNYIYDEN